MNNVIASKPKHPDDLSAGWCASCGEPCREMNQDDSYDDGFGNVTCWSTVSDCCEAEVLDEDPNSEEVLKEKLAKAQAQLAFQTKRAEHFLYGINRIRDNPASAIDQVALTLSSWNKIKKGGDK